jgi:nicotinamide riboside kinase
VLKGKETFTTMQEMHKLNEEEVVKLLSKTDAKGIFCDTGTLVLDLWSEIVFGKKVSENKDEKISDSVVDLYLLCETVKQWEPDPIRLFPDYHKRVEVNRLFRAELENKELPYVFVPILPIDKRLDFIEKEIRSRFDV